VVFVNETLTRPFCVVCADAGIAAAPTTNALVATTTAALLWMDLSMAPFLRRLMFILARYPSHANENVCVKTIRNVERSSALLLLIVL
jgi:hypothetical protein